MHTLLSEKTALALGVTCNCFTDKLE